MSGFVQLMAASVIALTVGGAVFISQPVGQPSGLSGASADAGPAAYVHGTTFVNSCCGDYVETFDADGNRLTLRGMVGSGQMRMDDPRLSGAWEQTTSIDEFPQPESEQRVEVHWGELTITNDDGAWAGAWTATYDSAAAVETPLLQFRLTGEGAYEGLSALLSVTSSGPPSTVAGAIFPGPLPPQSAYEQ